MDELRIYSCSRAVWFWVVGFWQLSKIS